MATSPLQGAAGKVVLGLAAALLAGAAGAAEIDFAPESTEITFQLGSTLHEVHGVARLEEGHVRFEPDGGAAGGRIAIDATSLDTDNGLRDAQMHGKVLESERFPKIEFLPDSIEVEERGARSAQIVLVGRVRMHGGEWPLRIPARLEAQPGGDLRAQGSFVIPYVQWGMRDMSNFLLSVDPSVVVHFDTHAQLPEEIVAGRSPAEARR
jgi:polyisoprenoid-binding protein YceI